MKVAWYATAPSPHLVGLLDALADHPDVELNIVYLCHSFGTRQWTTPTGNAPHRFLAGGASTGLAGRWRRPLAAALAPAADKAEIAVIGLSYVDPAAHLLSRALRRYGVPWVFFGEPPSAFSSRSRKWLRDHAVRRLAHRASGLIGVTEETVRQYQDDYDFRGPTTWAPYHRDLEGLKRLRRSASRKRVRFLVAGDLIPRKAPEVAIAAFARVRGEAELWFVGDGPLKSMLQHLIARLDVRDVRLLGRVEYQKIGEVMAECDVLLFPSRHDGFGMVTMEALAAGLPVIGSDRVMSVLQYVQPDGNGWIFPVDDVETLAERMQHVVDHRDRLPEWSQAARGSIKRYDVEEDADRLVSLLRAIRDTRSNDAAGRCAGGCQHASE